MDKSVHTVKRDYPLTRNLHPAQTQVQSPQGNAVGTPIRRGKWSPEEEAYAQAAIRDFNSGHLDAPPGTTLRTFLSEKLQCDPMRITKKFTGDASIGKKVFHPAVRDAPDILKDIKKSQANLEHFYQNWKQRLESQEHEMARKTMAAAAVSVASSLCDNPNVPLFPTVSSSPHLLRGVNCMRVPPDVTGTTSSNIINAKAKEDITQTAAWLERANTLLSNNTENNQIQHEIEKEMEDIAHLINEAPAILAISAGLPKLLNGEYTINSRTSMPASIHKLHSCPDLRMLTANYEMERCEPEHAVSAPTTRERKRSLSEVEHTTNSPSNPMKLLASLSSQAAPVPIVAKDEGKETTSSNPNNHSDAEDAKTFVNFLQSVEHVKK